MAERPQTPREEFWNVATHAPGVALALLSAPMLWAAAPDQPPLLRISVLVFLFGMLMCYSSSSLYHLARNAQLKFKLRVWDHISIFLLIGGTYTPVVNRFVPQPGATRFLMVMWGIILAGMVLKLFFTGKYKWLSVTLYLGLGWMAVFLVKPLSAYMPMHVFVWILAGGLSYTAGTFFYLRKQMLYSHAIWHLFVLGGTVCHLIAVYLSLKTEVVFAQ